MRIYIAGVFALSSRPIESEKFLRLGKSEA